VPPEFHLQNAKGLPLLRAVHISPNPDRDSGLTSFNAMQWQDEDGTQGQDSVIRIVNYLEGGGELGIEVDGVVRAVVVSSDGRFLITQDAEADADPILDLPTYGG
jgi:hypothetical protein